MFSKKNSRLFWLFDFVTYDFFIFMKINLIRKIKTFFSKIYIKKINHLHSIYKTLKRQNVFHKKKLDEV